MFQICVINLSDVILLSLKQKRIRKGKTLEDVFLVKSFFICLKNKGSKSRTLGTMKGREGQWKSELKGGQRYFLLSVTFAGL